MGLFSWLSEGQSEDIAREKRMAEGWTAARKSITSRAGGLLDLKYSPIEGSRQEKPKMPKTFKAQFFYFLSNTDPMTQWDAVKEKFILSFMHDQHSRPQSEAYVDKLFDEFVEAWNKGEDLGEGED